MNGFMESRPLLLRVGDSGLSGKSQKEKNQDTLKYSLESLFKAPNQ
jgi:hypothetical protein